MRFKIYGMALLTIAITGMLISCGLFLSNLRTDMPESIGFAIPSNLYDANRSTGTNGVAYDLLLEYVTGGKTIADGIDSVLSAVYQHSDFFMASAGNKVWLDSGEWFYFAQLDEGFYLYFGDSDPLTNFYIDWVQQGETGFNGKAVWMETGGTEFDEAVVYYDSSLDQPYLDIYAHPTTENSDFITQFRLKLVKVDTNAVKAYVQGYITNPDPDMWMEGWNIAGYGVENGNGGAYCYTIGSTNGNFIADGVHAGDEMGTNYLYREFFDSAGDTLWRLATVDFYETDGITPITNSVVVEVLTDTYTNDSKPADIETVLNGMTLLSDSVYPTVELP